MSLPKFPDLSQIPQAFLAKEMPLHLMDIQPLQRMFIYKTTGWLFGGVKKKNKYEIQ